MATSTNNFKVGEFSCRHCGENRIAQHVIDLCQKIRDYVGLPVFVNSAYRCEVHNKRIGGVKNSYHTQGLAADITCCIGAPALFEAIHEMYSLGLVPELSFCYLYHKKNFVHVDIGRVRDNGVFQVHD